MPSKRVRERLRVIALEAEPPKEVRLAPAIQVFWGEQIIGNLGWFDQRVGCVGQVQEVLVSQSLASMFEKYRFFQEECQSLVGSQALLNHRDDVFLTSFPELC